MYLSHSSIDFTHLNGDLVDSTDLSSFTLTFALLMVRISLIPTYLTTAYESWQEYQSAVISFFVIFSTCAVLIYILGPKLRIKVLKIGRCMLWPSHGCLGLVMEPQHMITGE